ncbi:hypothetical protein DERP_004210 [Dermatophagoides pteronyssinus]|uniref:Uncharacterized protein n=1 Tax=Dermatophagoides pteronyssinus TaxID=6956 RepID=A0ABQ8J8I8_DERPT|nr:hypothetical protein DERP_004210 [Dermatophagoides pteronyssinus]
MFTLRSDELPSQLSSSSSSSSSSSDINFFYNQIFHFKFFENSSDNSGIVKRSFDETNFSGCE